MMQKVYSKPGMQYRLKSFGFTPADSSEMSDSKELIEENTIPKKLQDKNQEFE
jgi:hypothetical protein